MTLPSAEGSRPAGPERALADLGALRTLITALGRARSPTEVASAIVSTVPRVLGANAAVLGILSDDGQVIHTAAVTGAPPEVLAEQASCSIHDGSLLSDAARTGELVVLPQRPDRVARSPAHAVPGTRGGDGAAVAAPMTVDGHVIGVIGLSFAEDRPFDAADRAVIEVLAGQCALAWERAREVETARHELGERRRAEDALRASDARLRAALSAARMGVFTIDLATGRVEASESVNRLFGLTAGAAASPRDLAAYLERIYPEDRPRVAAALEHVAEDNDGPLAEFRVLQPGGRMRTVLARGVRIRDTAGKVRQVTGAMLDITRRRRTELELERVAGQLRTVLDHLPVAVWLTDAEGEILLDNPAGERIWGRRFTGNGRAGVARGWLLDSGRELTAAEWSLARALREGVATPEEVVEIERPDGERRTILSSCMPVKDHAGNVLGAVVMNEDITEQRRAERQARFQAEALAGAADAVIAIDPEERVTFWNSGAERLYGLPATTMVGRPLALSHRYLWPSAAAEMEAMAALAQSGRWLGEALHLTHDGRELVVEASVNVIRDPRGNVTGQLAVIRDITARHRIEAALRDSQERLRLALLATPVTLYAQDRELRYTFMFNPAAGFSDDFAIGKRDEDFMAPEHAARLTALKRRALDSGQPLREVIETDAGGETIFFDLMVEPLRDASGTVTGVTGAAVDITARRRAEAERDALLAGITHDLKNPLAAIRGLAQLGARTAGRAAAEEARAFGAPMEGIITAARRMDALLDDFLDIARTRSGRALELDRTPASLEDLVTAAVEQAGRAISTDHRLVLEREPGDFTGTWDTARLERVTANLLSNAMKFSPGGSRITVRLWRHGADAYLSVRDEGAGIPAADIERIFEPFYRGSNVAGHAAGSGLGLATARQIIEQHGGSITVESTEGAGTTVTVRLPVAAL